MLGTISQGLEVELSPWYDISSGRFGPERDEVTGEWRRLHNEELYDLYSPPNVIPSVQIRKNEMGGACGTYGGKMHAGFGGGDLRERDPKRR
jgi:hypothetical protein